MGSSLINFVQFLSSCGNACAKMEVCVWGGTVDVQFLCVFCLFFTLAICILASSARFCPSSYCLRPYTTGMKHLVLPYWTAHWRGKGHFTTAWCLFLSQTSCFEGANETLAFFFLWAFILPQCYMWDFTDIKKADECEMTSAYRAAALLNSMPNLFF